MKSIIITDGTIAAGQVAISWTGRILDYFRSRQSFRLEYNGPNYRREKFLWWTTLEEGEKLVIEISGKPHFCEAVLKTLQERALRLKDGTTIDATSLQLK